MRVSAGTYYACKALLELALHWPGKEPVQIQAISDKQRIPMRYLVQILIQLKQIGLVNSTRGKEGGYNLVKPPKRISLGEVLRQMQGPLLPLAGSSKENGSLFSKVWDEAESAMANVLDKVSFEDICNKARGMNKTIIYQI